MVGAKAWLKDSYILFICKKDPFKDERISAFLRFIHTNEPGKDDFSNRLSAQVEKIKDNEKFRRDYAAMNLHDRDITRAARREGLLQGAAEKAIENAKALLADGKYSAQKISELLNIPVEAFSNDSQFSGGTTPL